MREGGGSDIAVLRNDAQYSDHIIRVMPILGLNVYSATATTTAVVITIVISRWRYRCCAFCLACYWAEVDCGLAA
ncbi:MAG: hypothetical protein ABI145_01825 [Steroidobacteraceae bacterium]